MDNSRVQVALIEDDPLVQLTLKPLLRDCDNVLHPTLPSFLASPDAHREWDLILLDLCHDGDPKGEGTVASLPELQRRYPQSEIIIQSGVSDLDVMRACIRNGATRFLLKEHVVDEVGTLLKRQLEIKAQREALENDIRGQSPVMKRLKRELLALKLDTRFDVLIEGETGSGKELCARALRNDGPFVAVNVSAVPAELFEAEFFGAERGAYTGANQSRAGYFESAGTGTLFLDEIQSLPLAQQSKLLRVLESRTFTRVGSSQERPLRARIVCAANLSLRESVNRGLFREDLYYRIAPLTVQVPPLRVRGEDVAQLATLFLREFDASQKLSFTPAGLEALRANYDWPGNVRELRGFVRSLALKSAMPFVDAPEILALLNAADNTPKTASSGDEFAIDWNLSFDDNVTRLEKHLLQETLAKLKSSEAREKLGLARSRFYEKVKQHGLLK